MLDFAEDDVSNSERDYQCWFIENPISKDLAKSITLRLSPKCEQEFIIVIRSPQLTKKTSLLSMINLTLLTMKDVE